MTLDRAQRVGLFYEALAAKEDNACTPRYTLHLRNSGHRDHHRQHAFALRLLIFLVNEALHG